MIIGGNQPYFIPYLGYWQLINAVDVFIVADDYKYIYQGWINRNRILINGKSHYINIEVERKDRNKKKISEINISPSFNREKKLKQIDMAYKHAPFYNEGIALIKDIILYPEDNLSKFLIHSIYVVCNYLNISTQIKISSHFHQSELLKREERIFDYCSRYGNNILLYNAIGGKELYTKEEFQKHGITLKFLKMDILEYKQFGNPFVPNLSIIDVIMFNGKESVIKMLNYYTLE